MKTMEPSAGQLTTLRNLTPHDCRVFSAEGDMLMEIPASGRVARVGAVSSEGLPLHTIIGTLAPIPTVDVTANGVVVDLPPAEPGVGLIVSRITAFACPDRRDLFFPDDEVRDDAGQIIGCRRLGRVAPGVPRLDSGR